MKTTSADNAAAMEQVILWVSGRVQGVYYRAGTQKTAYELGLNGYAKNLPDGRVEVLAAGPRPALEKLVEFCGHGPREASVSAREVVWQPLSYREKGFQVL
ncbi:MAG: acylphosphatase [Desulfarculales bacterium]|jgi:acylphosphatase|nr:acylphosphatase [Desulfarculales bacterium]